VGYYCPRKKLLLACETIGVFNGTDDVVPSFLVGYNMSLESIKRVCRLDIENILVPHYGLLNGDKAQLYLKRAMDSTVSVTEEIVTMLKNKKSKEEIYHFFKNKFYHGYIKEIYPVDAMELNTGIMINLIEKEFLSDL